MSRKIKVAIAMSGGVDSGVAAALLSKQGFDCVGFHMHLWCEEEKGRGFENKCCSTESLEAARKTAHQLGMPFYVIDFSAIFKKRVVDYFLKEYVAGLTPNPCVMCNKFIKFGELLSYVRKLGFDYLATGHYARVVVGNAEVGRRNFGVDFRFPRDRSPVFKESQRRSQCEVSQNLSASLRFHLLMGKDQSKDQSYFLYNLTQSQLAHILFPVGDYKKKQVVAMAKKWKLAVAHRPESQEICFFPETDYRPFLKRNIYNSIEKGEVVDVRGRVIGRHNGLPLYTIGQRHGFTINVKAQSSNVKSIPPLYVVGKDIKSNRLIVGFGKETEGKEFWVEKVSWVLGRLGRLGEKKVWVRIRHQGELLGAKLKVKSEKLKVILAEPERGVAPGQAAAFYQGEEVLGGGIITR